MRSAHPRYVTLSASRRRRLSEPRTAVRGRRSARVRGPGPSLPLRVLFGPRYCRAARSPKPSRTPSYRPSLSASSERDKVTNRVRNFRGRASQSRRASHPRWPARAPSSNAAPRPGDADQEPRAFRDEGVRHRGLDGNAGSAHAAPTTGLRTPGTLPDPVGHSPAYLIAVTHYLSAGYVKPNVGTSG